MDLRAQFAFKPPTAVIASLMDLPDVVRNGLEHLLVDIGVARPHNPHLAFASGFHRGVGAALGPTANAAAVTQPRAEPRSA